MSDPCRLYLGFTALIIVGFGLAANPGPGREFIAGLTTGHPMPQLPLCTLPKEMLPPPPGALPGVIPDDRSKMRFDDCRDAGGFRHYWLGPIR